MNFGLGLVLSFTDNATNGINNAVDSLGKLTQMAENANSSMDRMASLSALSVVSNQMGSSFTNMGRNIISTLGQVISKVNDTGQTLKYAQQQLDLLYKSEGEGAGLNKLAQIQDYAKKSIFEFEDLIGVVTQLKTVGIEAFDSIASSAGNYYDLMTLSSDLSAFNPNMVNAYGTGIQAAMGALKEYIAEGNAMSLKRGAGLDITSILGEEKGATMAERSRQVADLIEQLGMVGMTASLAESPMTKLSNMSDTLFQFLGMVSNSGVYDKFNSLISKFADYVMAIPDEELQTLAKTVGSALTAIMNPLDKVADKVLSFADSVRSLVGNNPKLAKFATIGVALAGALFLVVGVVLKATSALSGFSLFLLTANKSFSTFGKTITTGLLTIMKHLLPLLATVGLLYLAWKTDFAGIKTMTTSFVSNVVSSFSTARNAINGDVSSMIDTLNDLNSKGDFFSNFTISLMKVMQVIKSIAEAWNSYTLSEDNYQKANELGVLPLIESFLQLKYRFDFFKQGFLDGWREIGNRVQAVVGGIASKLDGTIFQSLIDKITEFFNVLSSGNVDNWYKFGETFASFTAKAVAFFAVFSTAKKVGGLLGGILKIVKPLVSLIVANPVVAVIAGIVGALGLLYAKCEPFRNLVNNLFSTIGGAVSSVIQPMKEILLSLFLQVSPLISKLVESVKSFLPVIASYIESVLNTIFAIAGSVAEVIAGLMPTIMQVIGTIGNTLVSLVPVIMSVVSTVLNVVKSLLPIITKLVDMLVPFIITVGTMLGDLIANVIPVIADLIGTIVDVVTNLIDLVMPMITRLIDALLPVIKTIMGIVTVLVSRLTPVIETLVGIISDIIKMVLNVVTPIITVIVQIVEAIVSLLLPIIDTILVAIGFVIDVIMGIVQVVVDVIGAIVSVITGVVNVIMSIINTIVQIIMAGVSVVVGVVQVIINTITTIISSIIHVVQAVWDGIVNVFSNAIGFFSDVFGTVFDIISGVFNNIADFFTGVWNTVVGAFATIGDSISNTIKNAINGVIGGAVKIINGFIKAINFAIDVINAIPGVKITKLDLLEVPELAKGGVVDRPTYAMIGEAGKEAVVPLENNTEWVGQVAHLLSDSLRNNANSNKDIDALMSVVSSCMSAVTRIMGLTANNAGEEENDAPRPVTNYQNTDNSGGNDNSSYMTSNNNSVVNEGDTDNSVVFEAGSIVIHANGTNDEELMKMAKKLMTYIKRQKELEDMLAYN